MNPIRLCSLLILSTLALAPGVAQACGEGMFNTGQGLPYRSYLAPRPAAVLVFATPDASDSEQEALFAGLQKAGHTVTVVRDTASLQQAVSAHSYDVVISDFDVVDAIPVQGGANAPSILPVVARSARNSPQLRERFDLFVLDGASLGQYLKVINQVVKARVS